jgi:hypothetical protein
MKYVINNLYRATNNTVCMLLSITPFPDGRYGKVQLFFPNGEISGKYLIKLSLLKPLNEEQKNMSDVDIAWCEMTLNYERSHFIQPVFDLANFKLDTLLEAAEQTIDNTPKQSIAENYFYSKLTLETLLQYIKYKNSIGVTKEKVNKWIFVEYGEKYSGNLLNTTYWTDFNKMKLYSAKQSVYYKEKYPNYNSTYYKVE